MRTLVENYQQLKTSDDVVDRRSVGKVRAVLPRWIGGTDGVYTLGPVIDKLARQVDFKRIPEGKLTIPVVSLQSGKLLREKPESMLDRVIGSASIPLAIEPRRASLWMEGYLSRVDGDRLQIEVGGPPGLAAGVCKVRVNGEIFACDYAKKVKVRREPVADPLVVETEWKGLRWEVTLKTRDLPKALLGELAARIQDGKRPQIEFTTLHQFVDGGVTDNIPLRDAYDVWILSKEKGEEFDAIFVLTTGSAGENLANKEVRGGMKIAARAFEMLWGTYQERALSGDLAIPLVSSYLLEARQWIEHAYAWRKALESKLDADQLKELDGLVGRPFVGRPPRLFDPDEGQSLSRDEGELFVLRLADGTAPKVFVVDPQQRIFADSLKVDPAKIWQALHHGCRLAADLFAEGGSRPLGNVYYNPTLYLAEYPICDRFKR